MLKPITWVSGPLGCFLITPAEVMAVLGVVSLEEAVVSEVVEEDSVVLVAAVSVAAVLEEVGEAPEICNSKSCHGMLTQSGNLYYHGL